MCRSLSKPWVARGCHGTIMQNFLGPLLVDSIGVALAAFGFLKPVVPGFTCVAFELGFILNSTRLLPALAKAGEQGVAMVSSYCATKFSVFLIAACVTSVAENKQEQFSYTVGPKPIISITNRYGRIRVTPSSNKRVVATVLHSDTVEVQQRQRGNRIVLETHPERPPAG